MLNLPLYYFLYLFFAVMLVWLVMSLAGLFHLLRYCAKDKKAPFIALVFVSVSVGLFILFFIITSNIDWLAEISFSLPAVSQQGIIQ